MLGLKAEPENAGDFDLVVVGGWLLRHGCPRFLLPEWESKSR